MRILVVSPWLPSIAGGAAIRTLNLVKLASHRHEVSVISFVQPHEQDLVPMLRSQVYRLELVPFAPHTPPKKWPNRLRGWYRLLFDKRPEFARTYPVLDLLGPVQQLIRDLSVDVVQVESLLLAEVLQVTGDVPAILSTHNVESIILQRGLAFAANPIRRLQGRLAWRKLQNFEQEWVSRYPACLAVSDGDAALLSCMAPAAKIHVVPNGVDCTYFSPPSEIEGPDLKSVVFVGNMAYEPNVDGAEFFCREIWPLILSECPDASLSIVGARPSPRVLALQSLPNVRVTGYVDDIRPHFWQAAVSIVPLRVGGGTRFKILESLAARCPVVSTTVGAEGLNLRAGHDLLLGNSAGEFASCTVRILSDRFLRDRLASQGQATVRQRYDWRQISQLLEPVYEGVRKR